MLVREGTNQGVGVGVEAIGNEIIFEAVVHEISSEAVVRAFTHHLASYRRMLQDGIPFISGTLQSDFIALLNDCFSSYTDG